LTVINFDYTIHLIFKCFFSKAKWGIISKEDLDKSMESKIILYFWIWFLCMIKNLFTVLQNSVDIYRKKYMISKLLYLNFFLPNEINLHIFDKCFALQNWMQPCSGQHLKEKISVWCKIERPSGCQLISIFLCFSYFRFHIPIFWKTT